MVGSAAFKIIMLRFVLIKSSALLLQTHRRSHRCPNAQSAYYQNVFDVHQILHRQEHAAEPFQGQLLISDRAVFFQSDPNQQSCPQANRYQTHHPFQTVVGPAEVAGRVAQRQADGQREQRHTDDRAQTEEQNIEQPLLW